MVGWIQNKQHLSTEKSDSDQKLEERTTSVSGWENVSGPDLLVMKKQAYGSSVLKTDVK